MKSIVFLIALLGGPVTFAQASMTCVDTYFPGKVTVTATDGVLTLNGTTYQGANLSVATSGHLVSYVTPGFVLNVDTQSGKAYMLVSVEGGDFSSMSFNCQ